VWPSSGEQPHLEKSGEKQLTWLLPIAKPFLKMSCLTFRNFVDVLRKVRKATGASCLVKRLLFTRDPLVDASSCYRSCNSKIIFMICCTPSLWVGCGAKLASPFKIKTHFSSVVCASRGMWKIADRLKFALP